LNNTTPHIPLTYRQLSVGFGNVVIAHRVLTIVSAESAPMKRLRQEAKEAGRLIDLTEGRKTRSIILLDTNHVVLSAIQVETLVARLRSDSLMESEEFTDEWDEED
jgi:regulator of extracellular matrix RemA (YlzA/DUF370 family)